MSPKGMSSGAGATIAAMAGRVLVYKGGFHWGAGRIGEQTTYREGGWRRGPKRGILLQAATPLENELLAVCVATSRHRRSTRCLDDPRTRSLTCYETPSRSTLHQFRRRAFELRTKSRESQGRLLYHAIDIRQLRPYAAGASVRPGWTRAMWAVHAWKASGKGCDKLATLRCNVGRADKLP